MMQKKRLGAPPTFRTEAFIATSVGLLNCTLDGERALVRFRAYRRRWRWTP